MCLIASGVSVQLMLHLITNEFMTASYCPSVGIIKADNLRALDLVFVCIMKWCPWHSPSCVELPSNQHHQMVIGGRPHNVSCLVTGVRDRNTLSGDIGGSCTSGGYPVSSAALFGGLAQSFSTTSITNSLLLFDYQYSIYWTNTCIQYCTELQYF